MQGVTPQNRHVVSLTHEFLNVHWDQKGALLLGCSGGPDSKALLYALLECGVKPHVAHVDHGWREESRGEEEALRREVEGLGCPFFSVRLDGEKTEDAARRGRFAFFRSMYGEYGALLLAHQADDLAETVLKRIFEGAHLSNLGGMEEVSEQQGMTIWRPFLKVRKSELLTYLDERSINFFTDQTNFDPAYLRSRMRLQIFPFLNEVFGKEVTENLVLLSERAHALRRYLDHQCDKIEQEHKLLKLGKENGVIFTRGVLETLLEWVKKGGGPRFLMVQRKKIVVDQGKIQFFSLDSKDSNSAG